MDFDKLEPPLPEGVIRISTEVDALKHLSLTPVRIATELGITGPYLGCYLGNVFQGISAVDEIRRSPILELTGSNPATPYGFFNKMNTNLGVQRQLMEQLGQTRFHVSPEAIENDPSLFPATFRDLPARYFDVLFIDKATTVLMMQLPEEDKRILQNSLSPTKSLLHSDCFALLAFTLSKEGVVTIEAMNNEVYEHIADEDLRKKYQHWPEQLIKGLIYYLQIRTQHFTHEEKLNGWKLRVVIPEQIEIKDIAKSLEYFIRISDTLREQDLLDLDKFSIVVAQSSILHKASVILENDFGLQEVVKWSRDGKPDKSFATTTLPLSRETFLNSDHPLASCFVPDPSPDVTARYREIDALLPPDVFALANREFGYLHGELPPAAAITAPEFLHVRNDIEITPADPIDIRQFIRNLDIHEIECLLRARDLPEAVAFYKYFGDFSAIISKARISGGGEDVWQIPDDTQVSITLTHLPEQNRHPYIRFNIPDGNGKSLRFVIGFKGAGAKSFEDTELLIDSHGLELPIVCNFKESMILEGDPDKRSPAPTPDIWGGDVYDGGMELVRTLALRAFVEQHAPHLLTLIPIPIDNRRYLSIPCWKDGETEWMPSREYSQNFLGGHYDDDKNLSVYISAEACDLRLRQLVDRVFVKSLDQERSTAQKADEITSGLKSLFWWNDESTHFSIKAVLSSLSDLTTENLLQLLAMEAEADPERAERVFAKTAGRLSELVGFIHGAGGHLGGTWREVPKAGEMGICFGGPLGMRNIDITGGLHDFDMDRMYFPWSKITQNMNWVKFANEVTELPLTVGFDLIYLSEALSWYDLLLFGRKEPQLGNPVANTVTMNQFSDVFLLNETSGPTAGIRRFINLFSQDCKNITDPEPFVSAISSIFPRNTEDFYNKGLAAGARAVES